MNHRSTPRLHTVDWLSKVHPTSIPVRSDLGTGRGGKPTEQVRHRAIRAVCRNQFVPAECCPPITFAARDKDDRARFVSQPVERLLDLEVTTVAAFLLRSTQARVREHVGPPRLTRRLLGMCQERRLTASRACTIAVTNLATSGRLTSSTVKFGIYLASKVAVPAGRTSCRFGIRTR